MQLIISILIIGLLWMIYDVINAPAVDENENEIFEDDMRDLITDDKSDFIPQKHDVSSKTKSHAEVLEDSEVDESKTV